MAGCRPAAGLIVSLMIAACGNSPAATTIGSPTTTTTTTIAALPRIEDFRVSGDVVVRGTGAVVAVSAREVWAIVVSGQPGLIGRLKDGAWTLWRVSGPEGQAGGLAVAPDGTVWVAGNSGVFSFDGAAWTRRFDDPAGTVGVDGDGTVWIGGPPVWLARLEGESWVRVGPTPQAAPARINAERLFRTSMAFLPDGEVWLVEPMFGWGGDLVLRYDGTPTESVACWEDYAPCPAMYLKMAAAPNGDLVMGGFADGVDQQYRVARFDGNQWTEWPADDWPSAESFGASDIAMGPDGVLWLAFEGGLASVDETEWTTRIEGRGVSPLDVAAVDVAPDGTVWYADSDGVHIFSTP